MAISVVMPALEMAQETGKLLAWRKREGESVVKGEPLLDIETDKVVLELEAPGDGILTGVRVQEGAVVPVGQTIAWILKPGETEPEETRAVESGRLAASAAPSELRISPKARRLAREHGVDLSTLRGSGPGGEILTSDVLAAASIAAAPAAVETLSTIGRLMAERTTASWSSVPHFFLRGEIDASALVKKRERQPSLTHTDILVALVARVLVKHPRLNASWTPAGIRQNADINIAIAIAVSDGVVAPVIPNANQLALEQIAAQRQDLTERARAGRLHPGDVADGTFTISNLGMYGVDAFTAIITPPQVAILAVGSIADRVVAVDRHPAVRPMLTLTLSSDHRVVAGARAAEFMRDLGEAIRQPSL